MVLVSHSFIKFTFNLLVFFLPIVCHYFLSSQYKYDDVTVIYFNCHFIISKPVDINCHCCKKKDDK